ncbi:MAG: DsbA family protein [Hyphomicrobiaceae bacterium]|nr:DsbA family protein [Hyphomicrobiaceae bacterium]
MKRHPSNPTGIRSAMRAGLAAVVLAAGATWLAAGDGVRAADGATRLAQAAPPAAAPAADAFNDAQKDAIRTIVKDYLLANPELMLEIQNALEARMEKLQAEKLKTALQSNAAEIYRHADAPVAGNPSGDIPVVEFFDYNCGYCKRAFSDIAKLVEKDSKIKLVMKELPILSKGSEEAARVALAARMQGKYWQVHSALINLRGEVNEQTSLRAAEKVAGIDMARLKKDMASEPVSDEIKRVRDLAQKMGIQGTPHFLVGDRAIPGAPGNLLEQIQTHVSELRKAGGCQVC